MRLGREEGRWRQLRVVSATRAYPHSCTHTHIRSDARVRAVVVVAVRRGCRVVCHTRTPTRIRSHARPYAVGVATTRRGWRVRVVRATGAGAGAGVGTSRGLLPLRARVEEREECPVTGLGPRLRLAAVGTVAQHDNRGVAAVGPEMK